MEGSSVRSGRMSNCRERNRMESHTRFGVSVGDACADGGVLCGVGSTKLVGICPHSLPIFIQVRVVFHLRGGAIFDRHGGARGERASRPV